MALLLDRGDFIWVNFSPQKGSEQAGHRPAMIISPRLYNEKSRCVLACPVTSNTAPWPWKVILEPRTELQGAILVDQVRVIDVEARHVRPLNIRATQSEIEQVMMRLQTLTGNFP